MLAVYLWKEWRVFRPTLLALAAIALLASPLLFLLPVEWQAADFVSSVTICTMAAVSIVVGAELLPYEKAGQRTQFLGRLPNGQSIAFAAKLLFLLTCLLAFTGFGYLVAEGWCLLIEPGFISFAKPFDLETASARIVVASLWTFALSSWISRATLAPILGYLLVFVIRPVLEFPFLPESYMVVTELIGARTMAIIDSGLTGGILLLAVTSYLRRLDKSHCKNLRPIGWISIVVPLILGGWQLQDALTPDPSSKEFVIHKAFSGTDQRYAFLNTQTGTSPKRAVIVDLQSGEWWVEGYPDRGFQAAGEFESLQSSGLIGEHDFMHLYDQDGEAVCFDGETAEPFDSGTFDQIKLRHQERIRRSKQNTTTIRLPDGRPAWIMNGALETFDDEGRVQVLDWSVPENGQPSKLLGFGIGYVNKDGWSILDLARERFYPVNGRLPRFVMSEGWLSIKYPRQIPFDWYGILYNPDTEGLIEVKAIENSWGIIPVGSGQVFSYYSDATKLPGYIRLIDLRTGEQEEVAPPDVPAGFRHSYLGANLLASITDYAAIPVYTANGHQLFALSYQHKSKGWLHGVARFDLETKSFGPFVEGIFRPISFPDTDIMLAIADDRRIERVNLVTGEREILFPREEL